MIKGQYCLFCLLLFSFFLNKAAGQALPAKSLIPETLIRESYSSQGRGIDFILKTQSHGGGWSADPETTALAVIALFGSHIDGKKKIEKVNASIRKAGGYLRKFYCNKCATLSFQKNEVSRGVALTLIVFSYLHDPMDKNLIKELRQRLRSVYSLMSDRYLRKTLSEKDALTFFWVCSALDAVSGTYNDSSKYRNSMTAILDDVQKRDFPSGRTPVSSPNLFIYAVAMSERSKNETRYEAWRIKVIKLLLNSQDGSGGWGIDRSAASTELNPVSTAYALLAMEFALGSNTGLKLR